jgi:hypothetical protein
MENHHHEGGTMKRVLVIAALVAAVAGALFSASAVDGKHVNGRAVSVKWQFGWKNWAGACCECYTNYWRGSICLYTISNGAIASMDTIYKVNQGFAYYPAFNLDGNKVAFYRCNTSFGSGGSCAAANGGKNTISIIDINGGNLTNLCELPGYPPNEGGLDWPAGEWIYYEYPNPGQSNTDSYEIWKVNYRTKENAKVCRFTVADQTMQCTYFRRFSLDLAADKMADQGMQKYLCTDPTYSCNSIYAFPGNCDLPQNIGGNCNRSISASGKYTASYLGGMHQDMLLNTVGSGVSPVPPASINISQLATWSQTTLGIGAELTRWAVNSDKWVLQQIGWYGHAGNMEYGTNQVACNWVDNAAIRISNNPKVTQSSTPGGDGTLYYGNCTGDMWIDGGAANAGKYEDAAGAWQPAPGYVPTQIGYIAASKHATGQPMVSMNAKDMIHINLPFGNDASVHIMDMQGKNLYSSTGSASLTIPAGILKPGVYVIECRSARTVVNAKISVDQ